jgi:LPS sulfotransferase NodH
MSESIAAPVAYIVAATPRTGSSLLCEGLAATGVAGVPDEIFAPHLRELWYEKWSLSEPVSFSRYLEPALRYARSGNGVVAFKIHWMHVAELAGQTQCGTDAVLSQILPGARFVNIVRRDRRAQALSWFRASRTDEWTRFRDTSDAARPTPPLDLDAVRDFEVQINTQQACWLEYFRTTGAVPLTIEYEDLDKHYRHEVSRVLSFLGLDPAAAYRIPEPRRVRQADAVTAGWRKQLELADRSR